MKTISIGVAGVILLGIASAAIGQTVPEPNITPVNPGAMPSGDPAPAQADPKPPESAAPAMAGTLVQRGGKWWNGGREATPAEIAAWKAKDRPSV